MNFITSALFLMAILYGYQCVPLSNEEKKLYDHIKNLQEQLREVKQIWLINQQKTHNSTQQPTLKSLKTPQEPQKQGEKIQKESQNHAQELEINAQKKRQELQRQEEQIRQEAQINARKLQENVRKIKELQQQQQEQAQQSTSQQTEDSSNSLVPQSAQSIIYITIGPTITNTTGFTYDKASMDVHVRNSIEHRVEIYSNSHTNETKIFRYSRDWTKPNSKYVPY